MPRAKAILQCQYPYHVTARCINKEWFKLPIDDVWNIFSRQLTYINWVFDVKVHSFVLMNNHFHLLVSTPKSNLSYAMANLMRETSRFMNESTNRINQVYGARHFRSIIDKEHYFYHAYKYVYRNPVVAGLTNRCENYPYSSLNFLLGKSKAMFPIEEDLILFDDVEQTIDWLNKTVEIENWKTISCAMKRSKFRLAKQRFTNLPHHLESDML